jgi:hypothetical protein
MLTVVAVHYQSNHSLREKKKKKLDGYFFIRSFLLNIHLTDPFLMDAGKIVD